MKKLSFLGVMLATAFAIVSYQDNQETIGSGLSYCHTTYRFALPQHCLALARLKILMTLPVKPNKYFYISVWAV